MEGILNEHYRGCTLKISAIDCDNWIWKVENKNGEEIACCLLEEFEYNKDAALMAAKEAADDFLNL